MDGLLSIPGVGPKRASLLERGGIGTTRDLIWYLPRKYLDRTKITALGEVAPGDEYCCRGWIIESKTIAGNRTRLIVTVEQDGTQVELVFFHGIDFFKHKFVAGKEIWFAGLSGYFNGIQFVHPEWKVLNENQIAPQEIEPRYSLTEEWISARIDHKFLQKACLSALEKFAFTDPIESHVREVFELEGESDLLRKIHAPGSISEVEKCLKQVKLREIIPRE